MREAMAAAPVGDDQFGEDPTVNQLQERVAALARQGSRAVAAHGHDGEPGGAARADAAGRRGDRQPRRHVVWHEMGGAGANAGVQLTEVGTRRPLHTPATWPPPASRPDTSRRHRRRSWRSRTRTTAAAAWSFPAADAAQVCAAGARGRHGVLPRRRPPVERRGRDAACRSPIWPRRSIWCRSRCRKGWALRAARCSRARAT